MRIHTYREYKKTTQLNDIIQNKKKEENIKKNSLAYMHINKRSLFDDLSRDILFFSFFDLNNFNMPWRAWNMLITPFNNQHIFTLLSNSLKTKRNRSEKKILI